MTMNSPFLSRRFTIVSMLANTTRSLSLVLILLTTIFMADQFVARTPAQAQVTPEAVCRDVRFLMERNITPYDLGVGGGVLLPEQVLSKTFTESHYADTWAANIARDRNAAGFPLPARFEVTVSIDDADLGLEMAVFRGMAPVGDEEGQAGFQPVVSGELVSYPVFSDGAFTVVIRRQDFTNTTTGEYTVSAIFPGGESIQPGLLRDNSTGGFQSQPPTLVDGQEIITIGFSRVATHTDAVASVGSREGQAAQVLFQPAEDNFGLLVDNWATQISLIGGDLAVTGVSSEGTRTFYLQDYGHQISYTGGSLEDVIDSNGSHWRFDWDTIAGAWMTADCLGFRLKDGRTFTGPLAGTQRQMVFDGSLDDFDIRLSDDHRLSLNWQEIAPNSETRFYDGLFTAELVGDRTLTLESTSIDLQWVNGLSTQDAAQVIELADREATITLDWVSMRHFSLMDNQITMAFADTPRSTITRNGTGLSSLEALDDVIHIRYADRSDGQPGEQRLLLSGDESYIELVTPPGMPSFDGTSLPGEDDYAPRALNNLGGECYPINTLQLKVNCPPNGHPNPANGNLWYAVTDLLAHGRPLDLALTRSYNSGSAAVDGPFGPGWTSLFLLDYDVSYDPQQGSRQIDTDEVARYPVGLDLTWAPRGVVTFNSATGSRHVFVAPTNDFLGGDLVALTMPGWVLSRDSLRDPNWILRQDNGTVYRFDRAGRLVGYGTANGESTVMVKYPGNLLDGAGQMGEDQPVVISDADFLRQLELYYDSNHHIVRSVLRDITRPGALDSESCDFENNCLETIYNYNDDGLLETVYYADGTQASYSYESEEDVEEERAVRLIGHDDPRAPVSAQMTYRYGDDDSLAIDIAEADGNVPWRRVEAPQDNNSLTNRTVAVVDERGNRREYVFRMAEGSLKTTGAGFTLLSETSPLDGVTPFDSQPITYSWENGILQEIPARRVSGEGRNTLFFSYENGSDHVLSNIRGSYPELDIDFQVFTQAGLPTQYLPETLRFPDGAAQTMSYDERGWRETTTDRNGGQYRYIWDDTHQLQTVIRDSDSTAVDYSYNLVGLVTSVTKRRLEDDPSTGHTIDLAYDGLGRLITVDHPDSGQYAIDYGLVPGVDDDSNLQITVTDPIDTTTVSTVDSGGRLIERVFIGHDGSTLRHEAFTYDVLGRPTSHTKWLLPFGESGNSDPIQLTTSYRYQDVEALAALPGETSASVIRGYQIEITDPYGRTESITYDALDRVRQVTDVTGASTRYDYSVETDYVNSGAEEVSEPNGLRIVQRDLGDEQNVATTEYLFDLRWQLSAVISDDALWEILFTDETPQMWLLEADQDGIASLGWGEYQNGRPLAVDVVQRFLELDSDTRLPSPSMDAAFDFLGRPRQFEDENGTIYAILYCPQEHGQQQTVYLRPGAEAQVCERDQNQEDPVASLDLIRSVTHDSQGRIIRVRDSNGTRLYRYSSVPGKWIVDVTLADTSNTMNTWTLHYNSLGEITQWIDQSGIVRSYTYDTLGRLRVLDVENQPEASFTFEYNALDLVTSRLDVLGRGTRYAYDHLGRLASQQDANTANATTYGYNSEGQLSTVISPLGSTTTFLYDDPLDPTRLTGIIEPTGSNIRFDWADTANTLTVSDARGNQTVYSYDSFGALWRIADSSSRSHEIHYDPSGALIGWQQALRTSGRPALHLALEWHSPYEFAITDGSGRTEWSRMLAASPDQQLQSVQGDSSSAISFAYDALGRLSTLQAGEHRWSLVHEAGRPRLTFNDRFGTAYEISYDALNRLTGSTVGRAETTIDYTPANRGDIDISITDTGTRVLSFVPGDDTARSPGVQLQATGRRVSYILNSEGLLEEITQESCVGEDTTEADEASTESDNCLRNSDEIWRVTERFVYDAQGRPLRHIDAEQNIETFAYDEAGNLSAYQDFDGKPFTYTYDSFNRLESITGPTGIRLLLNYDNLDHVIGICQIRAETGDRYQDCIEEGNLLETYSYDSLGRLQSQTFPTGDGSTTIEHNYDLVNDGTLSDWQINGSDPVTIALTDDGLGTLSEVSTNTDQYGFAFGESANSPQLDQSGELTYAYDAFGRLESVVAGDHTLRYKYQPDYLGYTVTDEATGAHIRFVLDERGYLTGIESGAQIEYFLNPDRRVLVVNISRDDGELIELQVDRLGRTQNITYLPSNFFVDNTTDANDHLQRQSILGSPEFFSMGAEGYISVIGYDNDNRPLTMRITERDSGKLLYLLTLTYSPTGQRETETRLFGDGTQVTIRYQYDAGTLLVEREISIRELAANTPLQNGSPLLVMAGAIAWLFHSPTRRRLLLVAFVAGIAIPLALSLSSAQPVPATTATQIFRYDDAGNLVEIAIEETDEICATFTYDNANRLREVTQDNFPPLTQSYQYDPQNRLAGIGSRQLVYHGQSTVLLATYDHDGVPRFHGQTPSITDLFHTNGETPVWFTSDGRNAILTATHGDEDTTSAWLFDPLGRFLLLDPPDDLASQPCAGIIPRDLPPSSVSPVQTLMEGAVWDPEVDLYFMDGRAYLPEIGRFLQRDPLGPDSVGNVYDYPFRQHNPPVRTSHPHFADGLFRLRDALAIVDHIDQLTVESILATYAPAPPRQATDSLPAQLNTIRDNTTDLLLRRLDLPVWLATQYNLPAPYLDDNGALRLVRDNAPGHGGLSNLFNHTDFRIDPDQDWLPEIRPLPQNLEQLVGLAVPPDQAIVLYVSFSWVDSQNRIASIWQTPDFQLNRHNTPAAVQDWLPQNLRNPAGAAATLDAVLALVQLPNRAGESWLVSARDQALPELPTLPPEDGSQWLRNWFTDDTLGIAQMLAERVPDLPGVNVPVYDLGVNDPWR